MKLYLAINGTDLDDIRNNLNRAFFDGFFNLNDGNGLGDITPTSTLDYELNDEEGTAYLADLLPKD